MKFAYRKFHPLTKRAYNAKRRARSYNAKGRFTKFTIENLYCKQRGKCAVCLNYLYGKFEVDHIIALANGGTNERNNIQLLCSECNKRKGVN